LRNLGHDFLSPEAFSALEYLIDRYIHVFQTIEFEEDKFLELYQLWENSILWEELPFDILVPIIYLTCDFDTFELGEHVTIEKMKEEIQFARTRWYPGPAIAHRIREGSTTHVSFETDEKLSEVLARALVEGAATHALVLKNSSIKNQGIWRRRENFPYQEASTEPRKKIDLFFAALRVVTGHATGYSHLVVLPRGWADPNRWKAFLPPVYVDSVRAYPEHFEDHGWLEPKPPVLTKNDCDAVRKIFHAIETGNKLILAALRLNAACLRRNEEDQTVEATIGLEILLADDRPKNLPYWLAKRLQGLCKLRKFESDLLNDNVFKLSTTVYQFRSAIVHASPTAMKEQLRLVRLSGQKAIPTVSLGIRLLRHALVVLAEYPEYLDVRRIDQDLLDE
jgi:hypothetical protein